MTLDEFTTELEAKLASMSNTELTDSLLRAGFELEDSSWADVVWEEASANLQPICGVAAEDSNELALAA
jgi:hypothetical protein